MIRVNLLMVTVVVLIGLGSQRLNAQTVDEIITKNIAARGGVAKINLVDSQHLVGSIAFGADDSGPFDVEIKRPGKMRVRIETKTTKITQVSDGKQGWTLNPGAGTNEPIAMNEAGKSEFYRAFESLGLPYAPTHSNFVWVDVKRDGAELFQRLLHKGVIVRTGDVFGSPTHLRVTIGTEAENAKFLAALRDLLT